MLSRWSITLLSCVLALGALIAARTPQAAGPQRSQSRQSVPHVLLPEGNVANGRYLAERVAMCVECHSGRDGSGNIIPSEQYMGGPIPFNPPEGWAMRAPRNRGLLGYNDDLAMRLLMQGAIDRHGNQLRPPMPKFRMSLQDAADVIAYLRTLE